MKMKSSFLIVLCFVNATNVFAQKDTLTKKLDSLSIKADTLSNGSANDINPKAYNAKTSLSFRNYFLLLGNDFKQQAILPFHARGKDWLTVAKFGAIAGVVSLADESLSHFAVKLKDENKTVRSASKYITRFGGVYEVCTLAGLATYGIFFKNEKIKTTTLLATQSYLTAGAVQILLKFVTARQRPLYVDQATNENEPTFHGPLFHLRPHPYSNSKSSSFPSGHTTAAFAAATVFAMEYRNKPFIPILSYSAATLIGLSRITENKHWPTDILVGAALGFLSGKQVVNNYHRFAKIKQPKRNKNSSVAFDVNFFQGKILPGIVYHF